MAYGSDIPALHAISADSAAFVVRAIVFSVLGILTLVGFIFARRTLRRRYFDRLASAEFYVRQRWEQILSGEIPADDWRAVHGDAEAIITLTLDRLDAAAADESEKLLNFLRRTGLLDRIAVDARQLHGWRREAALVRLGRTRAPEAVPILVAALDDPDADTQLAAVRGLARTGLATAAEAMLERVVTRELALEGTSLLNALMICTRSNPRVLLPYLHVAHGTVREVLARVMAETASLALGDDLLLLAHDTSPEVRASVARALAHADFGFAFAALDGLAADEEWFVRLRAITSLGQFQETRALPALLRGICDRSRHVRQRAAEALARMPDCVSVLRDVLDTHDAYALQALIAELDRAGEFGKLLEQLESATGPGAPAESLRLLQALENGAEKLGAMMRIPPAQKTEKTA
ncbi:MAG: HEAT repeat domain-containing protein [Candidatus Acidiferrales bacterium]